jgi:hypothetical protein
MEIEATEEAACFLRVKPLQGLVTQEEYEARKGKNLA